MQTCHLEMMLRSRYVGSIIGNNMYCICQYIYHFQLIHMSTNELCHHKITSADTQAEKAQFSTEYCDCWCQH